MHKAQTFFYLTASFLAGVFLASMFQSDGIFSLSILIVGIVVIAVTGYHRTLARTKRAVSYRKLGLVVGASLILCSIGAIRYDKFAYDNSVLESFANVKAGDKGVPVIIQGYVDDEPVVSGSYAKVIVRVKSLSVPGQTIKVNERTLVRTNAYPQHRYGHPIVVEGPLSLPENFDDFDYIQYLKNKGINTVMSFPRVEETDTIQLGFREELKLSLYIKIFSIKHVFEQALNRSLPEPYAAYINGILIGSRQNIPENIQEAFNETSTTHILAISGYNIAVISNALLAALVFVMKRRRAFWASVAIIVIFTILTGASASVVRASIMGLLLLFASGYGRLYDVKNSIILAGAIMIFINPFVLRFDVGFQLSFLAVIGLAYVYPILARRAVKIPALGGLKESFLMTLSAQIMVFPMLMFYFNQFSLVSLLANIAILPFIPYVMVSGFFAGVAGIVWPFLGQIFGTVAWAISFYQLAVIQWFSDLPLAALNISLTTLGLIIFYGAIIYLLRRLSSDR